MKRNVENESPFFYDFISKLGTSIPSHSRKVSSAVEAFSNRKIEEDGVSKII